VVSHFIEKQGCDSQLCVINFVGWHHSFWEGLHYFWEVTLVVNNLSFSLPKQCMMKEGTVLVLLLAKDTELFDIIAICGDVDSK